MSNAPSKPVSFSRPKVGYFSNRPRIAGFFPPFYADVNVFSLGDVKQYLTLLQIMHENNSVSK